MVTQSEAWAMEALWSGLYSTQNVLKPYYKTLKNKIPVEIGFTVSNQHHLIFSGSFMTVVLVN